MKTIELMEKLRKMPVFHVNDLAKITGLNAHAVRMLVWRLYKKKLIRRIERAKYTAVESTLAMANYTARPSYVGLYSALRFHNMTDQIVRDIDILVPKSRKTIEINGYKIRFTKTKHFWGFEKYRIDEFEVLVSDPEKTIIDCLMSEKISIQAVFEAIKSRKIDMKKIGDYIDRTNSSALAKRLGLLLEKAGYEFELCTNYAKGQYVSLDVHLPKKGKKNKKWKVIENRAIA